ncbi:MAG: RDD family protein [Aquitalea sp.]|nr:RDD family protein [Aquitalea sp.]
MSSSYPAASIGRRLCSQLYELLLVGALLLTVSAVMTGLQAWLGHSLLLDLLTQLALAGSLFGYFGSSWVKSGQTVAMKAWRVQLVSQDSGRLMDWRQAGFRYIVGLLLFVGMPAISYLAWSRNLGHGREALLISLAWCALPYLAAFYDKDRLFLHDRLARTRQITLPKPAHPGKGRRRPAA